MAKEYILQSSQPRPIKEIFDLIKKEYNRRCEVKIDGYCFMHSRDTNDLCAWDKHYWVGKVMFKIPLPDHNENISLTHFQVLPFTVDEVKFEEAISAVKQALSGK